MRYINLRFTYFLTNLVTYLLTWRRGVAVGGAVYSVGGVV